MGIAWKARIEKILPEMGFHPGDGDRYVGEFSGGWQMRPMGLGKILLQEPDVLLLDEPTNHLDLDTIEWLEGYLKGLNTPMVIRVPRPGILRPPLHPNCGDRAGRVYHLPGQLQRLPDPKARKPDRPTQCLRTAAKGVRKAAGLC